MDVVYPDPATYTEVTGRTVGRLKAAVALLSCSTSDVTMVGLGASCRLAVPTAWLTLSCSFFHAMLDHQTKEKSAAEVCLGDVSPVEFAS